MPESRCYSVTLQPRLQGISGSGLPFSITRASLSQAPKALRGLPAPSCQCMMLLLLQAPAPVAAPTPPKPAPVPAPPAKPVEPVRLPVVVAPPPAPAPAPAALPVASLLPLSRQLPAQHQQMLVDPNARGVPSLRITFMFGFTANKTFPYGLGRTVSAPQGSIKWSLEANNW